MENIKLRAKLTAYAKGILPSKLSDLEQDIDFIKDAPIDDSSYARKNGEWVKVENCECDPNLEGDDIQLAEDSGLNLEKDGNKATLSVRQKVLVDSEIPNDFEYEDDTTYYILETTPNLYINGGTAFSDERVDIILNEKTPSEYRYFVYGGDCKQAKIDLVLQPLNSKGVLYNE